MEKLPALGTAIGDVLMPTYQAYKPLLLKQADTIKSTKRETFTYGSHPRQQLDVYTLATAAASPNRLLIFLYGGGLVRGDKIHPLFDGLVYANVGHFFAEGLGCKVVIPDYRLISHGAQFPSGGKDLELVIQWVRENIAPESTEPLNLFMMGNSAGGIHLSTYLLAPQFAASRQGLLGSDESTLTLRGIIFLAVPFHFEQATADRADTLSAYYGDKVDQRCPLGLLRACKQEGTFHELSAIPVLVATGTLDPKSEILIPNDDFVEEWQAADTAGSNLSELSIVGQNHISPVLSVGTGIEAEELWGRQVIDFVNGRLNNTGRPKS